jgi:CBS-domain-containing membrane protein
MDQESAETWSGERFLNLGGADVTRAPESSCEQVEASRTSTQAAFGLRKSGFTAAMMMSTRPNVQTMVAPVGRSRRTDR